MTPEPTKAIIAVAVVTESGAKAKVAIKAFKGNCSKLLAADFGEAYCQGLKNYFIVEHRLKRLDYCLIVGDASLLLIELLRADCLRHEFAS